MKIHSPRNIFPIVLLALIFVCLPGTRASLHAQERSAQSGGNSANADSDAQSETPGQQLAHESREAAGEEKDETAEFKQSASVRLIARITGMSLQYSYWLSVLLNFA